MKITKAQLRKIIKEELKVISEVEVVNRDTGETLTMPWEFEEEYDDGEELPDSAFKALRRDIDKLSSKSQKNDLDDWGDDDLDAPMSDLERKVSRQVRDELDADEADNVTKGLEEIKMKLNKKQLRQIIRKEILKETFSPMKSIASRQVASILTEDLEKTALDFDKKMSEYMNMLVDDPEAAKAMQKEMEKMLDQLAAEMDKALETARKNANLPDRQA